MKNWSSVLAWWLVAVAAAFGQPVQPPIGTTTYSRDWLRSTNATDGLSKLGITGSNLVVELPAGIITNNALSATLGGVALSNGVVSATIFAGDASNMTINLTPVKSKTLIKPELAGFIWSKLYDGKLTWAALGDSTGNDVLTPSLMMLDGMLGLNGTGYGGQHFNLVTSAGAVTDVPGDQSVWWQGVKRVGNGGALTVQRNEYTGVPGPDWSSWLPKAVKADSMWVGFIQTNNAGSFKLQVAANGGAYFDLATINAAGSFLFVATNISLPSNGWWTAKVVGISAETVDIVAAALRVTNTVYGFNPASLSAGGRNYALLQQVTTNVFEPYLKAINPDLITFDGRHDAIPTALLQRVTNACPNAVIAFMTGHSSGNSYDPLSAFSMRSDNITTFNAFSAAGARVMLVDTLPQLYEAKSMLGMGFLNDMSDVHLTTKGMNFKAAIFWKELGVGDPQYSPGYSTGFAKGRNMRLLNNPFEYSTLGRNVGIGTADPRGRLDIYSSTGGKDMRLVMAAPGDEGNYLPGFYMRYEVSGESAVPRSKIVSTNLVIGSNSDEDRFIGRLNGARLVVGFPTYNEVMRITTNGGFALGGGFFSYYNDDTPDGEMRLKGIMRSYGGVQTPSVIATNSITTYGTVTAGTFAGNGSGITNLQAANLVGTVLTTTNFVSPYTITATNGFFAGGWANSITLLTNTALPFSTNSVGLTIGPSSITVVSTNGAGTSTATNTYGTKLGDIVASGTITAGNGLVGNGFGITNVPADRFAMRKQTVIADDFGFNSGRWTILQGNGGNNNFNVAYSTNGMGGFWNTTGTATNGYVGFTMVSGHNFGYTEVWADSKVTLFDAGTTSEPYVFTEGFVDVGGYANPSEAPDGVFWLYRGTNWLCVSKTRGNVTNVVDSGVAPVFGYGPGQKKSILINPNGSDPTKSYFYINDVCVATNTTSTPNPAYGGMRWTYDIRKIGGSAERSFAPDYFYSIITYPGGR